MRNELNKKKKKVGMLCGENRNPNEFKMNKYQF